MELRILPFRTRILDPLSNRVAQLSKSTTRLRTGFSSVSRSRGLRISLLAGLTLIFAFLAHEGSSHSAIERWINSHPPSTGLIITLVETKGFRPLTDHKQLHEILKNFKNLSANSIWLESTFKCLAWQADIESDPLVFCREGKAAVENSNTTWAQLGTGWKGVDRLVSGWDKLPNLQVINTQTKSRFEGDSREIRF